jgi:hypothetical protein
VDCPGFPSSVYGGRASGKSHWAASYCILLKLALGCAERIFQLLVGRDRLFQRALVVGDRLKSKDFGLLHL